MVQSSWSDERIDFALVQTVDNLFYDDTNVVSLSFLKERKATGDVVRKCANHLVVTGVVDTEDGSILAFNRIQNRYTVVPFVFPQLVFDSLYLVSADGHGR